MVSPIVKEVVVTTPVELQDSCNCLCCPMLFRRRSPVGPSSSPSPSIWTLKRSAKTGEHVICHRDLSVDTKEHRTHAAAMETFPRHSESAPASSKTNSMALSATHVKSAVKANVEKV